MKDIILSGFMNGGAGGGSAGVTSWNDLPDRPFGEEYSAASDTLTWDGNIDGKEKVMDVYYRVSSCVPTYEDFANGGTVSIRADQGGEVEDIQISFEEMKEAIDGNYSEIGIVFAEYFFVIPHDNYEIMGMVIPNAGIYFYRYLEEFNDGDYVFAYTTSITINGYGKLSGVVVNPIADKYIPDTIARKSDIPEHTWESLPDKPFYVRYSVQYEYGGNVSPEYWENKPNTTEKCLIYTSAIENNELVNRYGQGRNLKFAETVTLKLNNELYGSVSYEYHFRKNEPSIEFGLGDVVGYYGNRTLIDDSYSYDSYYSPFCVAICYSAETDTCYYVLCTAFNPEYINGSAGTTSFSLLSSFVSVAKPIDPEVLPKLTKIEYIGDETDPVAHTLDRLLKGLKDAGYMQS